MLESGAMSAVLPASSREVDAYRAHYRKNVIGAGYRPRLHLLATTLSVVGPAGFWFSQLRAIRPLELLIVPAMLVFGSAFVWSLHRFVLHRRLPGLRFAYQLHTRRHHRFFTHDRSEPEQPCDLHTVLFPPAFGPSAAVVAGLIGWGIAQAGAHNAGCLFAAMSALYFGLYELVHFASHLPAGHPVLRMPGLSALREHHRMHHVPVLMTQRNFNVVLPLFDWLLGTRYRGAPYGDGEGHRAMSARRPASP